VGTVKKWAAEWVNNEGYDQLNISNLEAFDLPLLANWGFTAYLT